MTAGNMRANGVRNLDLRCGLCHHTALMNADYLPDNFELMRIEPRLVCTRCGDQLPLPGQLKRLRGLDFSGSGLR